MPVIGRARTHNWFRALLALVLTPVPVALGGLVGGGPAPATAAGPKARVEVLAERTESSRVFANPDGTFTYEEHTRPQWVRRGGGWVAADSTLHRDPDGSIGTAATTVPMSFSGGGSSRPMATLGDAKTALKLWWPGRLPEPVLSGPTATYPEILPGVDLRITADVDRFTHVFVVKDRAAAARVAQLRLRTELVGLRLSADKAGRLHAVDGHGAPVLSGASPLMWDSSGGGDPGAREPRSAAVGVRLSGDRLTLTPSRAMVEDPGTVYPLLIDPEWSADKPWVGASYNKSHWTVLRYSNPTTSYYDRTTIGSNDAITGVMRAGFNDFEGPTYRDRSLFRFNISPMRYKDVGRAQVRLTQAWAGAGCGDTAKHWVDMHQLNATFGSSTTWNTSWNSTRSGWGQTLSSSYAIKRAGYTCAPDFVEFDVTKYAKSSAADGKSDLWLGLRARDETDKYAWKRYKNDAVLVIDYNSVPDAPTPLSIDGRPCTTDGNPTWVTTGTPVMAARQSDSDTAQQLLTTTFHWGPAGAEPPTDAAHTATVTGANPLNATAAVQAGSLTDGGSYTWRASTSDTIESGQESVKCDFRADLTPPNDPGVISAATYNASSPTGGPGVVDQFTFRPPTDKADEVVGYAWTLDGATGPAAAVQVDTVEADQTAVVAVAPAYDGFNILRVWTKDRAGRYSANSASYPFQVSPGGLAARYTFDQAAPGTDVTGHPNSLTLTSTSIVDGRSGAPNRALSLDGTSGYAATGGPVTTVANGTTVAVATNTSFIVAAWVQLSGAGTVDQVAASVRGTNAIAYELGYAGTENRWVFRMAGADTTTATIYTAKSDNAPVVGRWTHLAGVYDGGTKKLTLYVGSVAQTATATLVGGFATADPLYIGRRAGTSPLYLAGAVDDVRVYNTAFTSTVLGTTLKDMAAPLPPVVTGPATATFGAPVTVQFSAGGDANVTTFVYALDSPVPSLTVAGPSATRVFNGVAPGPHKLVVRARDANGLNSPITAFRFSVTEPGSLAGVVTGADGAPIAGVTVSLDPSGLTAVTDVDGVYFFDTVAAGTYTVSASTGARCGASASMTVDVSGESSADLVLSPTQSDSFGYVCADGPTAYTAATALLPISGDDAISTVTSPFPIPFYGTTTSTLWVDVNGVAYAADPGGSHPQDMAAIPNRAAPGALIAPFWSDLVVDSAAGVYTSVVGSAPHRQLVVEWRNIATYADPAQRLSFEALIGEDGDITFAYKDVDSDVEAGQNAVIGIENRYGSSGVGYAAFDPAVSSGSGVTFAYPASPATVPEYSISGTVTAAGVAAAGVTVTLDPFGLAVATDATGGYRFDGLPAGSFHVTAQLCSQRSTADLTLSGSVSQDFALTQAADPFGYRCSAASAAYVPADDAVLPLTGDDNRTQVALPFAVPFYGQAYQSVWVSTNGHLTFTDEHGTFPDHDPGAVPSSADPNALVAPFWTDLVVDGQASVRTAVTGAAPNRTFTVEWRDVYPWGDSSARLSFEAILGEDGTITFAYAGLDSAVEQGSQATVAIENPAGTGGLVYSDFAALLNSGEAVTYSYPSQIVKGLATVSGTATVGGAVVPGGVDMVLQGQPAPAATDPLGRYHFGDLVPGTYAVTAYYCGQSASATVTVETDATVTPIDVPAAPAGGYGCSEGPASFAAGDTQLAISGDDVGLAVGTPFPVTLYGQTTSTLWVGSDGVAFAADPGTFDPRPAAIPDPAVQNSVIAPFWQDLMVDAEAGVYTRTSGTGPNRQFVVEWRNVRTFEDPDTRMDFEIVFFEDGRISFAYANLDGPVEHGSQAVVGLENSTGTAGFAYSFQTPLLGGGRGVTFTPAA